MYQAGLRLQPTLIVPTQCVCEHHATSRKFTGSVAGEVIGIFYLLNSSGRTMALGSTQTLTEVCTRDDPYIGLTTLPPFCADCLEIL